MKILIKSAKIIDPKGEFHQKTRDILLAGGKIKRIAETINETVDRQIKVKNLHVSSGWFDPSVGFGEPGFEERETLKNGLLVAAKSGFTSIGLNANTFPIADNAATISFFKEKCEKSPVKIFPIGALTKNGKGKALAELYDMHQSGALAFGDYKQPVKDPNLLKIALQYAQGFQGLVESFPQENAIAGQAQVHEGHYSTLLGLKGVPAFAEELQIARDLYTLEYTGGKLHIPTISTEKSVKLIREAQKKGLQVSCSVAIHNLIFTEKNLENFDTHFKTSPPLRTDKDRRALLTGLKDGVIQIATSDHTPVDIEHKKIEFELADYGTLGLESAFGALQPLLGLEKTIEVLTRGRLVFGLPRLGIAEGENAELTFFDPEETYRFTKDHILSTSKNSLFLNTKLTGKALGVFSKNKIIVH